MVLLKPNYDPTTTALFNSLQNVKENKKRNCTLNTLFRTVFSHLNTYNNEGKTHYIAATTNNYKCCNFGKYLRKQLVRERKKKNNSCFRILFQNKILLYCIVLTIFKAEERNETLSHYQHWLLLSR